MWRATFDPGIPRVGSAGARVVTPSPTRHPRGRLLRMTVQRIAVYTNIRLIRILLSVATPTQSGKANFDNIRNGNDCG
jgi:hypothetical protein